MVRLTILGMAVVMAASTAFAAPLKLAADSPADDHQLLADGFAPFDDQAAKDGWAAVTPDPAYLTAGTGKPTGAPLTLKPGAYRVVVLCGCNMMEVTLLRPDNSPVAAERSDDRRAMYSLDVPTAGAYLTGIDMDDCPKLECAIGVKVYRKAGD